MSIKVNQVSKVLGNPPMQILSGINLDIPDGDYVSVTGRSGSGKSTLLYLISTLDHVSQGTIEIDGKDVSRLTPAELNVFRNQKVGFVFQFHYLLAELSVLENVLLPAQKFGQAARRCDLAKMILDRIGLGGKLQRLPRQLSGGEQQRAAIARALVMEPQYLFADEPTGSLDTENSEIVLRLFGEVHQKQKMTIVLVTHDPDFAKLARRQIHLVDGKIVQA